MRFKKLLLVTVLWSGALVWAPKAEAVGPSIFNFQFSGIDVMHSGGNTLFPQISWTPYIPLGIIGLRGEAGLTNLSLLNTTFWVTNYDLLVDFSLLPGMSLEVGAGMHFWSGIYAGSVAYTANLVFSPMPALDRVFIGYSHFTGGVGAEEFRAGIGFELF